MSRRIIVGSRGSKLALIQAESVVAKIREKNPDNEVSISKIATSGDLKHHVQLIQMAGNGGFVKVMEEALLDWDESIPEKYIDPAIEILIEKGHILTAGSGNSETLSLTNDGYDYYIIIAPKQARKIKKTASMRAVGLWNKYKYQNRIDMEKERARLLS